MKFTKYITKILTIALLVISTANFAKADDSGYDDFVEGLRLRETSEQYISETRSMKERLKNFRNALESDRWMAINGNEVVTGQIQKTRNQRIEHTKKEIEKLEKQILAREEATAALRKAEKARLARNAKAKARYAAKKSAGIVSHGSIKTILAGSLVVAGAYTVNALSGSDSAEAKLDESTNPPQEDEIQIRTSVAGQ